MKKQTLFTLLGLGAMLLFVALFMRRCAKCSGVGRVCSKCGRPWDNYAGCKCIEAGGEDCLACGGSGSP